MALSLYYGGTKTAGSAYCYMYFKTKDLKYINYIKQARVFFKKTLADKITKGDDWHTF